MEKVFNNEKIINLGTYFVGNSVMVIFDKNRKYKYQKGQSWNKTKYVTIKR